jgi:hypothetical protein
VAFSRLDKEKNPASARVGIRIALEALATMSP